MKTNMLTMLLLSCSITVVAQRAPMRTGKVDIADLEMEQYPGDSSVSAAILCDFGEFFPSSATFVWKRRFKVFTKEGLNYFIMVGPSRFKGEVRGFVYNLVDGKIIREKISNKHIYIEEVVEGRNRVRVAPPNVVEGSVIDIEYTFKGWPVQWKFQYSIPVRYSELILPDWSHISFRTSQRGYETVDKPDPYRYVAENLPAFKSEPYINSPENYMTSLTIDVKEIQTSYMYREEIANRWPAICQNLWQSKGFGELLDNPCLYLNDIAKSIQNQTTDRTARIVAALDTVHQLVTWNEVSDLLPVRDFRELLDDGAGTSSDLNFLFMLLLRKLDIECYPLVMSQRSEGILNPLFPSTEALNYVITYIPGEEENLLVDASDRFSPPGLLPDRAINGFGLLINGEGEHWVEIVPRYYNSKMVSCNLQITENMMLEGIVQRRLQDYAATEYCRKWDKYVSEDEYLEKFESEHDGVFITEFDHTLDPKGERRVQEQFTLEIDDALRQTGTMVTFCPLMFDRWTENPFKLENREYPVDFATPIKRMTIMNIVLPEGCSVEQIPEPVSVSNESGTLNYLYNISQQGQMLQVMTSLQINKPVFMQDEYMELQNLFNVIVSKENENVILKRL